MSSDGARPQSSEDRLTCMNNVWLDMSVELARREISVGELRQLKHNDVIELPRLAGEPFDVLLNGRMYAEGEVVVVTDQMAVRLTRMIDCEDAS